MLSSTGRSNDVSPSGGASPGSGRRWHGGVGSGAGDGSSRAPLRPGEASLPPLGPGRGLGGVTERWDTASRLSAEGVGAASRAGTGAVAGGGTCRGAPGDGTAVREGDAAEPAGVVGPLLPGAGDGTAGSR